jgi:uncharacterized protein (TIGR02271 family)
MDNTVVGVYDSYARAESALNELLTAGFPQSDVQLAPDMQHASTGQDGMGGAVRDDTSTSSIGNFFRSLFGMEEEHRERHDMYSEALRRGSCVLTVNADTEEMRDRAVDIMNRHDPIDIDERAAHWRSQGWSGYDASAPRMSDSEIEKDRSLYTQGRDMSLTESAGMNLNHPSTSMGQGISDDMRDTLAAQRMRDQAVSDRGSSTQSFTSDMNDEATRDRTLSQGMTNDTVQRGEGTRIPVVEEELRVGKREVQRGGVRVYQRVQEKPVSEQVELREERVNVERRPVDRPASEADFANIKDGAAIEMRESAEEAVVSKTARVVEEVIVNKEATQRTEQVNDTVRRTDVDVQQVGASDTRGAGMSGMADDDEYRRHWQSTYGSSGGRYEDYDSAYRYGSTMAGSGRFKNYRWEDVEPDVRSDWESNHPESTWDKVKDAVRYGAEKVSGRRS